MSEQYRFFDSIDGEDERFYTADEFAEYFRQFIRNGVFSGGENLKVVTDGVDMNIKVNLGYAFIEGYLYKINKNPLELTLENADASLDRIDRIVVRLDRELEHRYIKVFILNGTSERNPRAPELTRNDNVYEISLASIRVTAGKSHIEAHQINDERLNTSLCGITTHLFERINTTSIFNQWQEYLNYKRDEGDNKFSQLLREWNGWSDETRLELISQFRRWFISVSEDVEVDIENFTNDFITWFESIKGSLSEDVAGGLYLEVEDMRKEINQRVLPIDVGEYNSASQWADILIPDAARGKALLKILLYDEKSSSEVSNSIHAMTVIMKEDMFDKNRQMPFDYDQILYKLGHKTEVGRYIQWVEELLSDYKRGIEKLYLGLILDKSSSEIASSKYAMNIIMQGEELDGLVNYRKKLAEKIELEREITRLDYIVDNEVERLDSRINEINIS